MPERTSENLDHTDETFTRPDLEVSPDQAPDARQEQAGVESFDFARLDAELRRDTAVRDIERLAGKVSPEEARSEAQSIQGSNSELVSVSARRGRSLITGPTAERAREHDRLADIRTDANVLLSRMVNDKSFAKEIMRKKDLGTNYTSQGITEAMAAAALPYARRAMRAAKRGNRYERMDLYTEAASNAANAVGKSMDLENMKLASHASGVTIQEVNAAGLLVDYKPPKKPINHLARQGLRGRLGLHLPAMRRFK